jgi:hypothetical protein
MKQGTPLQRRTPLRADPAKTREWQQRSRKPFPTSGEPMKRTEMSRNPTKKKLEYEAVLDAMTPALLRRCRGVCEMGSPDCTGNYQHRHHRKLGRGKGTQDCLEAIIMCCTACHDYAHLHRKDWAGPLGFIIRRSDDPKEIPVSKLRKVGGT